MINKQLHPLQSLGYISCDVPEDIKLQLISSIESIKDSSKFELDYRKNLVGNIQEEYDLSSYIHVISDYALELAEEYIKIYDYYGDLDYFSNDMKLVVKDFWVNFQKKGDFNPIHNHRGLFSFVIWAKIPYDLKEEMKLYQNAAESLASVFTFHYLSPIGEHEVKVLRIDKTWEWKMILFPAKLNHSVNPFYTSNEHRISLAGNISIDI
jgi:hypothetical protein